MILAHSTHTWLPLTEQWIYRQVKYMKGAEQIVICDKKDPAFPDITKTFYNPSSPTSLLNRIRNKLGMPDTFRNGVLNKYDDVILMSHYGVQGFRDLGLPKKKHVTRFYGYDLARTVNSDPRWKEQYKRLFDQCDLFIVEGESMKKQLRGLGCAPQKIEVNFLGTDVNEIKYQPREENTKLNVLIACATAERKGILYALKALERAINFYHLPIHIHWVGGRTSDYPEYIKYENLLKDFVKYTNLTKHITRHRFLTPRELQEVAGSCHVAMHPSIHANDGDSEGGYPVVLLDLMAGGLPVISTLHCDIPEVVNYSNGYLCPERDVDSLIAALVDAFEKKSYVGKSLLARKTVEDKFDARKLGAELSTIILG